MLLHGFQKKSQKTPKADLDLARRPLLGGGPEMQQDELGLARARELETPLRRGGRDLRLGRRLCVE